MPLSHFFISKQRKVDFEVNILLQDLTNVPLVSGFFYVKWRLKNAVHTSGGTARAPIRDHSIVWGHPISTIAHLVITKQHILGPCEFRIEVFQELGGSKESVSIGSLSINLSEYAGSGLTTRRYLLDDCKFNSTIKLSIRIDQRSQTSAQFDIPPLKKQQIFTDIPSMITDRQERPMMFDQRSLHSLANQNQSSSEGTLSPPAPVKKSQSAVSLPYYCRQVTSFSTTDDPSPTDLVEKLFQTKQPLPASSHS
ncbi:hypothetical protein K501DRAFT_233567 [Backusella circina FSU 941]|nr:hypothetical protein K501DRAFT_233567 [Backusella circina FSU 941]